MKGGKKKRQSTTQDKIRQCIYFLINQNIIISIAGGILCYGIAKHFNLQFSQYYAISLILLCFGIYTLQRISNKAKKNRTQIICSSLAIVISICILLPHLKREVNHIFSGIFFCFLCAWYVLPLIKNTKLRDISGVKIAIISLTWAYACAFFPLSNENIPPLTSLKVSLLIFLYFIAIILPFDIRDMHIDNTQQHTIPQLINKVPSKLLGSILLLSVYFGHMICLPINIYLLSLAIGIQLILLWITCQKNTGIHFGFIDFSIMFLGISYLF